MAADDKFGIRSAEFDVPDNYLHSKMDEVLIVFGITKTGNDGLVNFAIGVNSQTIEGLIAQNGKEFLPEFRDFIKHVGDELETFLQMNKRSGKES